MSQNENQYLMNRNDSQRHKTTPTESRLLKTKTQQWYLQELFLKYFIDYKAKNTMKRNTTTERQRKANKNVQNNKDNCGGQAFDTSSLTDDWSTLRSNIHRQRTKLLLYTRFKRRCPAFCFTGVSIYWWHHVFMKGKAICLFIPRTVWIRRGASITLSDGVNISSRIDVTVASLTLLDFTGFSFSAQFLGGLLH
ncbi:hypothetical protein CEXT_253921 [Caerostris extrusa]|uniref:Uncharacterized protein n=1 Tax=Caerostris extrusa TaxID=172846 RepID=A0AAV4XCU4_CAEEX|nr:hypothetical protein CEXT_253921 [Caerostris extrusa]